MQNEELSCTRESDKIMVKILDSIYDKSKLLHFDANAVLMNADEKINLLIIIKVF